MNPQPGLFEAEGSDACVERPGIVATLILRVTEADLIQLAQGEIPDDIRRDIQAEAAETLPWFDGTHPMLRRAE